jgi:outer membrane protein insertion porin family
VSDNGNPLGGNIETTGSLELIVPPPYDELRETVRLAAFFDFGNVFADEFDAGEFRYSTGIAGTWLSPLGVMTVSYGLPLNLQDDDEEENFQFSFGKSF